MKRIFTLMLFLMLSFSISIHAQSPTQTIRGTVVDKQSQTQIPGANVILMGSDPVKGSASDA